MTDLVVWLLLAGVAAALAAIVLGVLWYLKRSTRVSYPDPPDWPQTDLEQRVVERAGERVAAERLQAAARPAESGWTPEVMWADPQTQRWESGATVPIGAAALPPPVPNQQHRPSLEWLRNLEWLKNRVPTVASRADVQLPEESDPPELMALPPLPLLADEDHGRTPYDTGPLPRPAGPPRERTLPELNALPVELDQRDAALAAGRAVDVDVRPLDGSAAGAGAVGDRIDEGLAMVLPPVADRPPPLPSPVPPDLPPQPALSGGARPGPARRGVHFDAKNSTHRGTRPNNQDYAVNQQQVLALADGVGGGPGGAQASEISVRAAVRAMAGPPLTDDRTAQLESAAHQAHSEVLRLGQVDPALKGAASTLDLVTLGEHPSEGPLIQGLHVGDSAVWLLRKGEAAERLTTPHTDGTGRLLQMIGHAKQLKYELWKAAAYEGDRVVLASDGLWADLGVPAVEALMLGLASLPPAAAAHLLVESALRAGGSDNVSVVVADVVGAPPRPPRRRSGDSPTTF